MYVGAVAATPPSIRMSVVVGLRETYTKTHPSPPQVFVEGSEGYNVSLALLFTAANPGACVSVCTRGGSTRSQIGMTPIPHPN